MDITMTDRSNRRSFLEIGSALLLTVGSRQSSAQAAIRMKTFVYKVVDGLAIRLDVLRADDDTPRPVAVWIHGGALIMGHREGIDRNLRERLLGAGYALVSIDYRLAPESPLPLIIEDLEDAFAWIRKEGPRQAGLKTERIAVLGGSAGGYLTLAAGFRVRPRPTALVSLWGYGDLIGDWYSKPSQHPRHNQIKLSEAEAYRQVSGPPVSDARDRKGDGGAFYQYCRQHGLWPRAVSGWDPIKEEAKFVPYMPVRNVTAEYPPTFMIHGTNDTDVPYAQSVMMAKELSKHNVAHELVTIEGGEHGLAGADPAAIKSAYDRAVQFVEDKMRI